MAGTSRTSPAMTSPVAALEVAGLPARRIAAELLEAVLKRRRPLDEQLEDRARQHEFNALADRDRALVRRLVALVLRRLGTLRHLIGELLERGPR